jgi:hypothetical protein
VGREKKKKVHPFLFGIFGWLPRISRGKAPATNAAQRMDERRETCHFLFHKRKKFPFFSNIKKIKILTAIWTRTHYTHPRRAKISRQLISSSLNISLFFIIIILKILTTV